MKKETKVILASLLIIIAFAAGTLFSNQRAVDQITPAQDNERLAQNDRVKQNDTATYASTELGIQFEYTVYPNGYVLQRIEKRASDDENLLGSLLLMRQTDLDELLESIEGREGPPTISVLVFDDVDNMQLSEWLAANNGFTNFSEQGVEDITIGGEDAIVYNWEGLYNGQTAAVMMGSRVYVFTGNYTDPSDGRLDDFEDLLESVRFIN